MNQLKPKQFYSFSSKYLSSTVQAHMTNRNIDYLKLIAGNFKGIDLPVVFRQEYGKNFLDVLDTGYVSLYLISDSFKTVLESNQLSGWKTFSITLLDKNNNLISGFYGLSITGKSGPTHYSESEIIEKKLVPNGPVRRYFKGMHVEAWDGSDFFMPEGTCHIIVSKKNADILKKNRISNVELECLENIEMNVSNVRQEQTRR